jgi:hypothetical protein
MRTAFVCVECKPLTHLLSLVALATGIPQADLLTLSVCREHFGALNRGLAELYITNPLFCESPRLDLNGLIALIRHLKKHEDVETVIIDALHQVRYEGDKPTTKAERRLISSVLQSTAHVGHLHIIAGFYDKHISFPSLPQTACCIATQGKMRPRKSSQKEQPLPVWRWLLPDSRLQVSLPLHHAFDHA